MEVECSIDTLGYLVIWLFGELHYVFTKLLVIVSVFSGATLQKILYIPQWTRFGKLLGHVT